MTDRVEPALTKGGGGHDADAVAGKGDIRVAEMPPRYEPTPQGEQAVIPGTPRRAIPTGATRAEVPQKDIGETPLFGQDHVAPPTALTGAPVGVDRSLSDAGLCTRCLHARAITPGKGSTFWLCGKSTADPRFPKYPRLPVLRCKGFALAPDGRAGPYGDHR